VKSKVQRFEQNTHGRDFVVGDIHGCFHALETELRLIDFDESKDRLFSVGDLVDRGPASQDALDWIAKPWFHAVRGNHEDIAMQYFNGKWTEDSYFSNGGDWFIRMSRERQKMFVDTFDTLPYAIDIKTKDGLIGVVHAECGNNWEDFCFFLDNPETGSRARNLEDLALWSRDKISYKDNTPVSGVHKVYVGHTPIREVKELGNVVYIDTGCFYTGRLTVVEI